MSMRKYEHDTFYYGGEIVTLVSHLLNVKPSLDRSGIYIWIVPSKDSKDPDPYIVFLSLNDNDYRGSLEVHHNAHFRWQVDNYGVLDLNAAKTDCYLNKEKILRFLSNLIFV